VGDGRGKDGVSLLQSDGHDGSGKWARQRLLERGFGGGAYCLPLLLHLQMFLERPNCNEQGLPKAAMGGCESGVWIT
jgi:hypothetical protein